MPPALPPGKPPRSPVPGWMWLLFTVGAIVAGSLLGSLAGMSDGGSLKDIAQGIGGGAVLGLFCSPVLAGALALSGRFFEGTGPRIAGTLMFTGLLVVGLGAVFFAGCLCVMGGSAGKNFYH